MMIHVSLPLMDRSSNLIMRLLPCVGLPRYDHSQFQQLRTDPDTGSFGGGGIVFDPPDLEAPAMNGLVLHCLVQRAAKWIFAEQGDHDRRVNGGQVTARPLD